MYISFWKIYIFLASSASNIFISTYFKTHIFFWKAPPCVVFFFRPLFAIFPRVPNVSGSQGNPVERTPIGDWARPALAIPFRVIWTTKGDHYPIIYINHPSRWLFGISEPSTVYNLCAKKRSKKTCRDDKNSWSKVSNVKDSTHGPKTLQFNSCHLPPATIQCGIATCHVGQAEHIRNLRWSPQKTEDT